MNEKFCVAVALHLYRIEFKAFPLFSVKPPKHLPFSDTPYLFSLLNVYSSKNQSSKKNNIIFLYYPFSLRLFHPSASLKLQFVGVFLE